MIKKYIYQNDIFALINSTVFKKRSKPYALIKFLKAEHNLILFFLNMHKITHANNYTSTRIYRQIRSPNLTLHIYSPHTSIDEWLYMFVCFLS